MTLRRRYYVWLTKAYIKKWKKTIFSSLIIGGVVFFIITFVLNFYFLPLIQKKVQKVGYWGTYTISTIPRVVLEEVSYGLTKIDEKGKIQSGASYGWKIEDDGKKYTLKIRKGQYFHNNEELNAENLSIDYKDISKKVIDDYTIELSLKEPYSPFLAALSKPIIHNNIHGLGMFKIKKVDLNAGFVKSLVLQNKNESDKKKIIYFYPTQDALKMAFVLGEIDKAVGINTINIKDTTLNEWKNTSVSSYIDYDELVTLFYNTANNDLSNKKLRQALNYALPQDFKQGKRAYSPIPPNSVYFSQSPNYGIVDMEIAKSLLSETQEINGKEIEISTTEEHLEIAKEIQKSWKKVDIKSKIKIVNGLPRDFQVLIYPFRIPDDPDQYTLWHSNQQNNISNYKSLRIDKLLEDGRSTTEFEKRLSIYSDFQKYIIDDVPASFLYFPKKYIVERN